MVEAFPWVVILGVNPEPWAIGNAFAGRKDGKMRGGISPNPKVVMYKNALAEAFAQENKSPMYPSETLLTLEFYFYRQIETWTTNGRKYSGNYADATNLQKSTEDALQGLLYPNDRQVKMVTSVVMEQGPDVTPAIVIRHREFWMEKNTTAYIKSLVTDKLQVEKESFNNDW